MPNLTKFASHVPTPRLVGLWLGVRIEMRVKDVRAHPELKAALVHVIHSTLNFLDVIF